MLWATTSRKWVTPPSCNLWHFALKLSMEVQTGVVEQALYSLTWCIFKFGVRVGRGYLRPACSLHLHGAFPSFQRGASAGLLPTQQNNSRKWKKTQCGPFPRLYIRPRNTRAHTVVFLGLVVGFWWSEAINHFQRESKRRVNPHYAHNGISSFVRTFDMFPQLKLLNSQETSTTIQLITRKPWALRHYLQTQISWISFLLWVTGPSFLSIIFRF